MLPDNLKNGDYVKILLKNGDIYKGNVVYIDENSIKMCNIEFEERRFLIFNLTEIENICHFRKTISKPDNNDSINNHNNKETVYPSTSSNNEISRYSSSCKSDDGKIQNKFEFTENEYNKLKKMTENYVFITKFGNDFNRSLSQLLKSQSVSVAGLGIPSDNSKCLSLLVFATYNEIFIYDMLVLKSLNRLKVVLESPYITKIVHDGKPLYQHLNHYKIKMNNIFDTQVADSIVSSRDESDDIKRGLAACLIHHYNLPELIDDELYHHKNPVWYERPLIRTDKRLVALLVVFLRKLRNDLQYSLLTDLHEMIQNDYDEYVSQAFIGTIFKTVITEKNHTETFKEDC